MAQWTLSVLCQAAGERSALFESDEEMAVSSTMSTGSSDFGEHGMDVGKDSIGDLSTAISQKYCDPSNSSTCFACLNFSLPYIYAYLKYTLLWLPSKSTDPTGCLYETNLSRNSIVQMKKRPWKFLDANTMPSLSIM